MAPPRELSILRKGRRTTGGLRVEYSAYRMDTSRFRVRPGEMVRLRRRATDDTRPFEHKRKAVDRLKRGLELLVTLQELLYAENRWSLLLIFRAWTPPAGQRDHT